MFHIVRFNPQAHPIHQSPSCSHLGKTNRRWWVLLRLCTSSADTAGLHPQGADCGGDGILTILVAYRAFLERDFSRFVPSWQVESLPPLLPEPPPTCIQLQA